MALVKINKSGMSKLPLSYHRIFQVIEEVNRETGVYVKSYLNEEERLAEKDGGQAYSETCYYTIEGWSGPIAVEEAYGWLKENYPEFEGAEDC